MNKKKSFYFEDYTDSGLLNDINSNVIKISLSRVSFLSFIFEGNIVINRVT